MKKYNIFFTVTLLLLSLKSFSQDYVLPVLKDGVKNDILELIYDTSNWDSEYENQFQTPISYLRYTESIAEIFEKYDIPSSFYNRTVVTDHPHDSNGISSTAKLISIGNESYHNGAVYYQCVQFVQALSNAGFSNNKYGTGWKSSGSNLNKYTKLDWNIIAKFGSNGYYDGTINGHVAIAIGSTNKGVYVIDQNWEGQRNADYGKVGIHVLPWDEAKKYALVTIPRS